MRISDWSSDVCSSDLVGRDPGRLRVALMRQTPAGTPVDPECVAAARAAAKLLESLGHHVEEAAHKVDVAALGTANFAAISRSEERRVGNECVSTFRSLESHYT